MSQLSAWGTHTRVPSQLRNGISRCLGRNRTNKTLREWEYQQELEHNREEELADMDDEEIERYESYQATCGRCRYKNNRVKCSECEV